MDYKDSQVLLCEGKRLCSGNGVENQKPIFYSELDGNCDLLWSNVLRDTQDSNLLIQTLGKKPLCQIKVLPDLLFEKRCLLMSGLPLGLWGAILAFTVRSGMSVEGAFQNVEFVLDSDSKNMCKRKEVMQLCNEYGVKATWSRAKPGLSLLTISGALLPLACAAFKLLPLCHNAKGLFLSPSPSATSLTIKPLNKPRILPHTPTTTTACTSPASVFSAPSSLSGAILPDLTITPSYGSAGSGSCFPSPMLNPLLPDHFHGGLWREYRSNGTVRVVEGRPVCLLEEGTESMTGRNVGSKRFSLLSDFLNRCEPLKGEFCVVETTISTELGRTLIGQRGRTVRCIQEKTKVTLNLSRSQDNNPSPLSRKLQLTGSLQAIYGAMVMCISVAAKHRMTERCSQTSNCIDSSGCFNGRNSTVDSSNCKTEKSKTNQERCNPNKSFWDSSYLPPLKQTYLPMTTDNQDIYIQGFCTAGESNKQITQTTTETREAVESLGLTGNASESGDNENSKNVENTCKSDDLSGAKWNFYFAVRNSLFNDKDNITKDEEKAYDGSNSALVVGGCAALGCSSVIGEPLTGDIFWCKKTIK